MKTKLSAILLGFLGLLPLTFIWWSTFPKFLSELRAPHTTFAYAAIILSFLAGSQWAAGIKHSRPAWLFISNAFTLVAWALLWIEIPIHVRYCAFSAVFFIQGASDGFAPALFWPNWYKGLRVILSLCVSTIFILHLL